jgi:hypothetical protein
MRGRVLVAIFTAALAGAALIYAALSYYVNAHNMRFVTEPCRRNAAGEEVCPPPFKR